MKNKIIFILGRIASVFGTQIYNFVFALFVLYTTGSALNFAITLILETIPRILLGPVAGIAADRWNRKIVIVGSDFISALLLIISYVFLSVTGNNLWLVFLLTFFLNAINTVFDVTMTASLNLLFGINGMQQICAINEGITSMVTLISPVLGAVLYSFTDFKIFILLNGISFLLSAILELMFDFPTSKEMPCSKNSFLNELSESFTYIKKEKIILVLYCSAIFINIFYSLGATVSFPVIITNYLKMTEVQYGILETISSIGMLVSSAVFGIYQPKKKYSVIIISLMLEATSIFLISLPMLLTGEIPWFSVYCVILFLLGVSVTSVNINVRILMQQIIPDHMKGKVLGTLSSFCLSVSPIIILVGSIYIDNNNPYILVAVCGTAFIILSLILRHNKYFKEM